MRVALGGRSQPVLWHLGCCGPALSNAGEVEAEMCSALRAFPLIHVCIVTALSAIHLLDDAADAAGGLTMAFAGKDNESSVRFMDYDQVRQVLVPAAACRRREV